MQHYLPLNREYIYIYFFFLLKKRGGESARKKINQDNKLYLVHLELFVSFGYVFNDIANFQYFQIFQQKSLSSSLKSLKLKVLENCLRLLLRFMSNTWRVPFIIGYCHQANYYGYGSKQIFKFFFYLFTKT